MSTGRLKRKLGDLGVDTSSTKANESFCLVRPLSLMRLGTLTDSYFRLERHYHH